MKLIDMIFEYSKNSTHRFLTTTWMNHFQHKYKIFFIVIVIILLLFDVDCHNVLLILLIEPKPLEISKKNSPHESNSIIVQASVCW